MSEDQFDTDGGAVPAARVSWDDIDAKAQWEGGLDEALDWFGVTEVPVEGRPLWAKAKRQKAALAATLHQLEEFIEG